MIPTFCTPPCGTVDGGVRVELPQTLHGQLFLLAYDRCRCPLDGDDRWRFGLALRTAMLTDLYLTGHLTDEKGVPRRIGVTRPGDPLLRTVLDELGDNEPMSWIQAVSRDQRKVLGELPTVFGFDEASRHYRELEDLVDRGIPPITGMRQVIDAVHNAISANDTGPYST